MWVKNKFIVWKNEALFWINKEDDENLQFFFIGWRKQCKTWNNRIEREIFYFYVKMILTTLWVLNLFFSIEAILFPALNMVIACPNCCKCTLIILFHRFTQCTQVETSEVGPDFSYDSTECGPLLWIISICWVRKFILPIYLHSCYPFQNNEVLFMQNTWNRQPASCVLIFEVIMSVKMGIKQHGYLNCSFKH